MMTGIKKWLVYAVFSIATLIFLVYYLFPSESVARYLVSKASELNPDLRVSIGQVLPIFPPGLSLAAVRIVYDDILLLDTEEIRAFPRLRSIFSSRRTFFFRLHTGGGPLTGRANFISDNPNRQPALDVAISGLQLAEIPLIKDPSSFKISGVLKLAIHWENRTEIGPIIRARIEALDCELQVLNPLLIQDRFIFNRIAADISMQGRRVELKDCNFTGNSLDGRISGYGILQYPLNKSKIELTGRLSPHHQFLKQPEGRLADNIVNMLAAGTVDMSVLIQGTMENPSFSFY